MKTVKCNVRKRHRLVLAGVAALAVLLSSMASAAPFSSDGISINIPAGFEGPVMQENAGAKVFGYSKASSSPTVRTILQVTIFDPGAKGTPSTQSKEELSRDSETNLLSFLKGIARRKKEFGKGDVVHLSLGGLPASKIEWKGVAQGVAVNGVMYCVIVSGKVVSFHTQDNGADITPNMKQAMKAIEAVKVK